MPDSDRLAVANGGDGTLRIFAADTLKPIAKLKLGGDADNLRYDPAGQRLLVGYGRGAIGVFDSRLRRIETIHLPGHPEAFALSRDRRLFVNVPAAAAVFVADLDTGKTTAVWRLADNRGNFPLALDEHAGLLLIGTRRPPRLIGIDATSGRMMLKTPIDGDPDDIFIDERRHRVYVSCGAGWLDVLEPMKGGQRVAARLRTAPGARTSLFVPELERLFLAVPEDGVREAEIRVYVTKP